MARFLLVVPEPPIRDALRRVIGGAPHVIIETRTLDAALARSRKSWPDVAVVASSLADADGATACLRLRESLGDECRIVRLRDAGQANGDDASASAPHDAVLEVPIEITGAFATLFGPKVAREAPDHPVVWGVLRLEPSARVVRLDDREVVLGRRERRALFFLAASPNRIFTREEILQVVWDGAPESNPRLVDTLLRRLRGKLGDARGCIESVRGRGYRFTDPPPPASAPRELAASRASVREPTRDERRWFVDAPRGFAVK